MASKFYANWEAVQVIQCQALIIYLLKEGQSTNCSVEVELPHEAQSSVDNTDMIQSAQQEIVDKAITYGRSTKTVGEQLFGKNKEMTEDEKTKAAQAVYDAVLNSFPNLETFMHKCQDDARRQGYVETILGRRRHIRDMQLKPYEFRAGKGYVNPDIDPLDPKTLKNKNELPKKVADKLEAEFAKYKYKGQIYKRIKELEEYDHIKVINNTKKITDATRQCVNCVDLDTEILTTSGWKSYNEVAVGDQILSYSLDTNTVVRDTVNNIHYYPESHDTVRFSTATFDVISTPEHRWVVGDSDMQPRIKTTQELCNLKWLYPILRVGNNNFEDNSDITDDQLKLLGWIMTDGSLCSSTQGMRIYQSSAKPKNKQVYADMIATLEALSYAYTDYSRYKDYHEIYIKKNSFTDWVRTTFSARTLTMEFISSLSQRQAEILMRAMLQCDGTGVDGLGNSKSGRTAVMCCRNKQVCDAFQYLCFVAGYATNATVIDAGSKDYHSQHIQYDSMQNIPVANSIYYNVAVLRVKRAHIYHNQISNVVSNGVWCVSTGQGTWVARRNGKVFITGNSVIQGSAAELTKIAMLKVFNNKEWNELGARILLPVHDELIAEVPLRNAKRAGELLGQLMSEAGSFLPFTISCDVTTTYRWYGLDCPCPYTKPSVVSQELSADEIKWLQYHLFESEYILPVYNDPDGKKPMGDAALGVNGVWSEEMSSAITDYCNRYNISKDNFIEHIERNVVYGITT